MGNIPDTGRRYPQLEYDLIISGRQAIDGDTAQVGPEIAEHLDLPQVTAALKVQVKDDKVVVDRDNENTSMTLAMKMPCVVTVMRSPELRFASIKGKMKARKTQVPVYSADDLQIDHSIIGKAGSPTQVMKSFTPKLRRSMAKSSTMKILQLLSISWSTS